MKTRSLISGIFASVMAIATFLPSVVVGDSGSYLAARHASAFSDYRAATGYYARAIADDPDNPGLLENAVIAYLGLGKVGEAATVAGKLFALNTESQVAAMAVLADRFQNENYTGVQEALDDGLSVGPLVDGLLKGWAQIGLGSMSDGLATFDEVAATNGIEVFGLYHKALALAMAGDLEGAEVILSGDAGGPLQLNRRGIVAFAQVLSQLERNGDAIELLDATYGNDPDPLIAALRHRLEAGEPVPFDAARTARDGAAEVFLVVAGALSGEAADNYTLLYSRAAEHTRADFVDAIMLSASLLERLERYDLATESYMKVPRDHPVFDDAEMGRADALRKSGNPEAAIEALRQLSRSSADNPIIHVTLGDTLRGLERYEEAPKAYDAAAALYPDPQQEQWLLYFARGITHEREDRWEQAEKDFRFSLELNPGQPQVLNYLGYSFVEMGQNMEEALGMIEEAVAARPDSGYIVDSLGWVQFKMGHFADAVVNLERAAELMAVDPIVNDHLGDAYWAVGRKIEAEFQWKRALSFDPEEEDADRIRRKLEVGLDVVREEEGEAPFDVSSQDG